MFAGARVGAFGRAVSRCPGGFRSGAAQAWRHRAALASIEPCARRDQDQWVAAAAVALTGAAVATSLALAPGNDRLQRRRVRCEQAPCHDVRFTTYNVLSPKLATPSHYPLNAKEDVVQEGRWPKLKAKLKAEVEAGAIIGLQEVDLGWAGQLHAFFAECGYCVVFAQYGKTFNGYMGVMMAWPRDLYEAVDVDISRVTDTAPKGTWPKSSGTGLNPFGIFTFNGLKEVLGCSPPDTASDPDFEWKLAQGRFNEAIFVRLRPRHDPLKRNFCVSTYHMPCLFGTPEKVRAVNIHTYLLLRKLRTFAGKDPAVLMGDFNFKPNTSPYALAKSGGSLDAAAEACEIECAPLKGRLPKDGPWWQGGLESAYRSFHGKEPLFTNYAQSSFQDEPFVETLDYVWFTPGAFAVVACPQLPTREEAAGPFPNKREPSDHLLLNATLRLGAAKVA